MSALPEMPCQDLVEVITEYLEGGLSPTDRLRFEAHLDECGPCRRYVRQLQSVSAAARKLRPDDIPAPTREALVIAFRDWASSG